MAGHLWDRRLLGCIERETRTTVSVAYAKLAGRAACAPSIAFRSLGYQFPVNLLRLCGWLYTKLFLQKFS